MYDDEHDDEIDGCENEDGEWEPLGLTPIERAIEQERAMMRTIRAQDREIAKLHKQLGEMTTKLLAATESSTAWMMHAALSGAFTKESVAAMPEGRPDTVGAALAAAAARNGTE